MMSREIFIMKERKQEAKWGRHWSEIKGVVRVYDHEDNFLALRSFSTKGYLSHVIRKVFPKRFKKAWNECYVIISPEIIDEVDD